MRVFLSFVFALLVTWSSGQGMLNPYILGTVETFTNVNTSQSNDTIYVTYDINGDDNNRPPEIFWVDIEGYAMVDSTLTALDSGFVSYGGYDKGTLTYQWYRADNQLSTGAAISGATSSTYVPVLADETKYLRVVVTPVQVGGLNTTGTPVTSLYREQTTAAGFNPFSDITWHIAGRPAGAVDIATNEYWLNEGTGNNMTRNSTDAFPSYNASEGGFVDFELSNNEELVLDNPNPGLSFPVEMWIRFNLESYNAGWAHLVSFNSTQHLQQRASGAMYAGGVTLGFTATIGDWVVMRLIWSGSANTSSVYINETEVTSTTLNFSTTAFGTTDGRLGSNNAGTTNRLDGGISHIFIKSGTLSSGEVSDMWAWFIANANWD